MSTTPNSIITPQTPNFGAGGITLLTANTATDGTGTVGTVYTAGSNGSKCDSIRIKYTGNCVATVVRVFWNNGSTNATATNNGYFSDIPVPAVTNFGAAVAQQDIIWPISLTLPGNFKINVVTATTVANALAVTASGGDL